MPTTVRQRPDSGACARCGASLRTRGAPCHVCDAGLGELSPGTIVDNRYQIESVIGRGGMGIVYRGRDLGLGRKVALKLIAPSWGLDPAAVRGFQREASALAAVRSAHVVQVYAFGTHAGSWFFAMEHVDGCDLQLLLQEHRAHGVTIPLRRVITILSQIGEGIDAVHAAGLVHRDLKPANIIIERDTGRPVLVDFGLAVPRTEAGDERAAGTPDYMAPEQTGRDGTGAPISSAADLYALGCTAFELLTGRVPFDSADSMIVLAQHVSAPAPRVSSLRPDLTGFDAPLARAMSKDPAARHHSAAAFTGELREAAEQLYPPRADAVAVAIASPDARTPSAPEEASVIRVLVVDDDPAFRKFAVRASQLAFYRMAVSVAAAPSGVAAIEQATLRRPDLVLLDLDMPGLDGAETLARMRALPGGLSIRVVVVSGSLGAADRWRFSVLGVNDFIDKPVALPVLVQTVGAIAERSGWGRGDASVDEP
jgi:serine/threonine-protein kinase